MKHISMPIDNQVEIINITTVNPLMQKCQIKVLYVGENRNKTVINKDIAVEIAATLPGSPIVGYFSETNKDFEEHNQLMKITSDEIKLESMTTPYGFVPTDAKVWFQNFIDDGEEVREYLLTEGYLWTTQYPESKLIMEKEEGKGQSLEFLPESLKGNWTDLGNGKGEFFIINEAIIQKLCILGDNVEPCFEGSNIQPAVQFSLNDDFFTKFKLIMDEAKEVLNQGGEQMKHGELNTDYANKDNQVDKKKEKEKDTEKDKKKEKDKEKRKEDYGCKKEYNLEEIPEYVELLGKYDTLNTNFTQLTIEKENLETQVNNLSTFKANIELKQKEDMINTQFSILSDEDKKDVIENINNYSLEDIESKLSVICVRNKVNFNLTEDNDTTKKDSVTTYNLNDVVGDTAEPAWVKAVTQNRNK